MWILNFFLTRALATAPEPYPPLSGGSFSGPPQPFSPDPLVRYVYPASVDVTQLQVFPLPPATAVLADGTPESSFPGWETLTGAAPSVLAVGPGGIVLDFGAELPAWVELDSPDLSPSDLPLLMLGTSEYNVVDIIGNAKKQGTPVAYNGTYRLETNKQLYEGVRYAFISLSAAPARPFHITAFRAVVQAKPVNYTGSYAGDARTTRIYYAAAYTVRTNLEKDYMGAILEDRGDRISWAGDAHVAQATALAVFGNWWDVKQNLVVTGKTQNGIASYSLYFCDSVMDYFGFTHDLGTLGQYFDEVERILRGYFATFNGTTSLACKSQREPPRAPKTHAPKKQTRTQILPPPKP
jgi:alpha-L-rhamnosidase